MALLNPGSDNIWELRDVQDAISGDPISDATAQVTISDYDGVDVAGVVWPLEMVIVNPGTYRATLPPELEIVAGTKYRAVTVANSPNYGARTWATQISVNYPC